MSHEQSSGHWSGQFPTTAWSFVRNIPQRSDAGYLPALNALITAYWKPVFYFLRAKGYSLHVAEDLTQAFFLRLFERDWLRRADRTKGRFRNFLLKMLVRFVSDQGPKRAPQQQRFEQQLISIDSLVSDVERFYEPRVGETPETAFMKQWAAGLVERVMLRLRRFYEDEHRPVWYELFAATHTADSTSPPISLQELGVRFAMTREQVRYRLEVVQKRFASYLREEVQDQVRSEADVNDEIHALLALRD